jgi:hypothetical protein
MHRPRLLLAVLPALLLLVTGCKNDVQPVLLEQAPEWDPADYDLVVTATAAAVQAGVPVTFTTQLFDPEGNDVSASFDIRTEMSPPVGVIADGGGVYRFTDLDTFTLFAAVDIDDVTLVDSTAVDVTAGPAARVSINAEPPFVAAGDPVSLTAEVTDEFGNPTTGEVTWTVDPAASIAGNAVTATLIGQYDVTGHLTGTDATDSDGFTVEAAAPASLDISLSDTDVEKGQGIVVTSLVLDQFGNEVDWPVNLWTDGVGTEVWGDFVRFHDEGIFMVFGEIPEYSLSDSAGPVLVDSTGPQIRVTTPQRGAEIPSLAGPLVAVTGSVSDPWTGVTQVTINGDPATLQAGGLFYYEMAPGEGLNEIVVEATDGDGNVSDHFQTYLWGGFLTPGDWSEDGILARLNEGAIDMLEQLVEDMIEGGSLTDSLVGNVFSSPSYCLDLWVVELCGQFLLDIGAVVVGDLEMELTPHNPAGGFPDGYLTFSMDLMGLEITLVPTGVFSACAVIVGCYSESVDFDAIVGADAINLDVDVGLHVDSNNEIQVTLANTSVGINNLYLDLSDLGIVGDILGGVTTWILGVFEPLFEALLPPIMEAALPGVLEDAFSSLAIAQELDLLGAVLEIAAVPQDIDIDDWGMLIAMESAVAAEPGPNAPSTIGSWRRPDYDVPDFSVTDYDFGLGLADNFVNQLLHSVWQGGVMDFSMDSDELGLDLSQIGDFLPLTQIAFETYPLLPPVVDTGPTGLLELQLGDMLVNVYGDPGGSYGLMMQLAITLYAEAEVVVDADGLMQFELYEPAIVMDYVTSDWPDLDGEVVEDLMDAVVELIVPQITGALDELGGIALPELAGFGLESPAVIRDPAPVYYVTATGSLVAL